MPKVRVMLGVDLSDRRAEGAPVATLIAHMPKVVEWCPGNGTRYLLAMTPIMSTPAEETLGAPRGAWIVSYAPGTAHSATAVFAGRDGGYLSPFYVAEKLRIGDVDAFEVARVIGTVLGRPHDGAALEVER